VVRGGGSPKEACPGEREGKISGQQGGKEEIMRKEEELHEKINGKKRQMTAYRPEKNRIQC